MQNKKGIVIIYIDKKSAVIPGKSIYFNSIYPDTYIF